MKNRTRTFILSEEALKLVDTLPFGMKGKVIEALILDIFDRFEGNPEEVVLWALKTRKEAMDDDIHLERKKQVGKRKGKSRTITRFKEIREDLSDFIIE